MLTKMRIVVSSVNMSQKFTGLRPSGSEVARNCRPVVSRSTTYRYLKKAKKMGLLSFDAIEGKYVWNVTKKGQEFLEAWNERPF